MGLRVGREELKLRLDSKEGRHDLAFPGIWSTLTFFQTISDIRQEVVYAVSFL